MTTCVWVNWSRDETNLSISWSLFIVNFNAVSYLNPETWNKYTTVKLRNCKVVADSILFHCCINDIFLWGRPVNYRGSLKPLRFHALALLIFVFFVMNATGRVSRHFGWFLLSFNREWNQNPHLLRKRNDLALKCALKVI